MNGTWTTAGSPRMRKIKMIMVAMAIIFIATGLLVYKPVQAIRGGTGTFDNLFPFIVQCIPAVLMVLMAWQLERFIKPVTLTIDNQGIYQTRGSATLHIDFSQISSCTLNPSNMSVRFVLLNPDDDGPDTLDEIFLNPFDRDGEQILSSLQSRLRFDGPVSSKTI